MDEVNKRVEDAEHPEGSEHSNILDGDSVWATLEAMCTHELIATAHVAIHKAVVTAIHERLSAQHKHSESLWDTLQQLNDITALNGQLGKDAHSAVTRTVNDLVDRVTRTITARVVLTAAKLTYKHYYEER